MPPLAALPLLAAVVLILGSITFLRLLYILPSTARTHGNVRSMRKSRGEPSHMVIVLGSGGHTAEMMSLLRGIDPAKYARRTYIVSSGDGFSSGKALDIENAIQSRVSKILMGPSPPGETHPKTGIWGIKTVPRARKIHQPLYTSPISSLWCLACCLWTLYDVSKTPKRGRRQYPDVIVTNGPATAVIVILAATIIKFFGFAPLSKMRIIYVESWARVKTLSLSGKILLNLGLCDKFLVQWEALARNINGSGLKKKVEWAGFLVE